MHLRVLICFLVLFSRQGLASSPGWPPTGDPSAFASNMWELQSCAIPPGCRNHRCAPTCCALYFKDFPSTGPAADLPFPSKLGQTHSCPHPALCPPTLFSLKQEHGAGWSSWVHFCLPLLGSQAHLSRNLYVFGTAKSLAPTPGPSTEKGLVSSSWLVSDS